MSANYQGRFAGTILLTVLSVWHCQKTKPGESEPEAHRQLGLLDSGATTAPPSCGLAPNQALPDWVQAFDDQRLIASSPADLAARRSVLAALAAVPKPLVALFFAGAHGRIDIGPAAAACGELPATDEERGLTALSGTPAACWLAPQAGQPLRIAVKADPLVIRASLVRLFGFVQSEFLAPSMQQHPSVEMQAYGRGFAATREQLADAYLSDLKLMASPKLAASAAHAKSEPLNFAHITYANAVDSYYCSNATREAFAAKFPKAWAVFTDPTNPEAPSVQLGRPN